MSHHRDMFFDGIIARAKAAGAPHPHSSKRGETHFIETVKTRNGKKALFQYTARLTKPDFQVALIVSINKNSSEEKSFCDNLEYYLQKHPLDLRYNVTLDRPSYQSIRYIVPSEPLDSLPQTQWDNIQERLVAAMKHLVDAFDLLTSYEGHLEVREFGPVREATIWPRDLTVFVGPQASGKSLVAQVLFFMLFMRLEEPMQTLDQVLEDWLGTSLSTYTRTGTALRWGPVWSEDARRIWLDQNNDIQTNDVLKKKDEQVDEHMLVVPYSYPLGERVYIPSGRSMYSYFPPHTLVRSRRKEWPGSIALFYEELGSAIANLGKGEDRSMPHSTSSPAKAFVEQRIATILKGQIRYGHETITLDIGSKRLSSQNLAAGQMEIWPFFALVQDSFLARPNLNYVVFEEPEAHVHPGAQRMVMEILAVLVNNGVQVVLTTHSPYVLYAINNFLLAHQVQAAGRSLTLPHQEYTALCPDQVAAYCFADDGYVRSLLNTEVGLIDADELENVAEELGAEFSMLQDLLYDENEDDEGDDI